jgi:hypothetical protein
MTAMTRDHGDDGDLPFLIRVYPRSSAVSFCFPDHAR